MRPKTVASGRIDCPQIREKIPQSDPITLEGQTVSDRLLPSIGEINRRLTINAREERRLRTLLRLALEDRDDIDKLGTANRRPRCRVSRFSQNEEASCD
jgi:hypothetical protein